MTRLELAKRLYELKKKNLPNVIGLDRPLTQREFIERYLRTFKKHELESLINRAKGSI